MSRFSNINDLHEFVNSQRLAEAHKITKGLVPSGTNGRDAMIKWVEDFVKKFEQAVTDEGKVQYLSLLNSHINATDTDENIYRYLSCNIDEINELFDGMRESIDGEGMEDTELGGGNNVKFSSKVELYKFLKKRREEELRQINSRNLGLDVQDFIDKFEIFGEGLAKDKAELYLSILNSHINEMDDAATIYSYLSTNVNTINIEFVKAAAAADDDDDADDDVMGS